MSRSTSPTIIAALVMCLMAGPSECSLMANGSVFHSLYPRESETREVRTLDGMWSFRVDNSSSRSEGMEKQWQNDYLYKTGPVMTMPVPSSYNDIGTDSQLRDFVGWAWYDRSFYVSQDWSTKRVMIRFGSAHYNTIVWINGQQAVTHSGGHLPFEAYANKLLAFGKKNRITVAVNNTLTPVTLPPGQIQHPSNPHKPYPPGYFVQVLQMDFFNYAGIHRPVLLYATPTTCISQVNIYTDLDKTTGLLTCDIGGSLGCDLPTGNLTLEIEDRDGTVVSRLSRSIDKGSNSWPKGDFRGAARQPAWAVQGFSMKVPNAHLWWPWTMNSSDAGYMYQLKITLHHKDSVAVVDVAREPFGFRTVTKSPSGQLLINGLPFYCQGFGRHEDSVTRGKGVDLPTIARDFELMRWSGANCFRTSHYPYAEEIMDEADRQGFAVIDESPGVGLKAANFMEKELLGHHMYVMAELINRDRNRPSVIMWSIANEPTSSDTNAQFYFAPLFSLVKTADQSRPVTVVIGPSEYDTDKVAQMADVICLNRYYGWYSDMGHLEVVYGQLTHNIQAWSDKFKKPVIMTEYGADTISGLHSLPTSSFTEDYQVEFMKEYHHVFDTLRSSNVLVGEMAWNFADFMTNQQVNRVNGNKKGVFTRDRQPKPAAFSLRKRYLNLTASTVQ